MNNNDLEEVDCDFALFTTIVWNMIVSLSSTPWNSMNRSCSLMLTRIMIVMIVGSEMDTFAILYWKKCLLEQSPAVGL